jgi:phenylpropionate dioxygenase-like ring-hydroxylating dioxygenase large terminal subunit
MVLVTAPSKNPGVLCCPYHSWCYALNGELKVTPHVGGPGMNIDASIDRPSLGLLEVRSAEWLVV